ncbi:hypothetical protein [Maribacter sp. 2304DJ31-5]|uniref:hypothetical protein n=1 Tax=Maribacter sp. 2304DJ31-5 TaxID=3386273 RepID=UPI0039BC81A2
MDFIRKIAPVVLLSIFSLTIFHSILPHIHHGHDVAEIIFDEVSEHDHHLTTHTEKHDQGDDKHEHNGLDFLHHFLEGHSHNSIPVENVLIAHQDVKRLFGSDNFVVGGTDAHYGFIITGYEKCSAVRGYSLKLGHDFHLSSFSHRGPPSLV